MRLVLLILALLLTGSVAVADPRQDTDKAMTELRTAEQSLRTAAAAKVALSGRYEEELRTIDRLKKQRGSWRRDRQLRDSLAVSLETAKKLEVATAEQKRAEARQQQAKQRTLLAVAAELRTPADAARSAALTRERDRLAPAAAPVRKIVLPELSIDPLADPEELEQQAAAIRESEAELAVQVASLDHRAARLGRAAELRKQHARASDLSEREQGQTRRGTFRENDRFSNDSGGDNGQPSNDGNSSGDPSPNPQGPGGSGGGEAGIPPEPATPTPQELAPTLSDAIALAESSTVLGDVIDAASIESLRKAQVSADPAVRAAAAKKARDAAAAKLELLRKSRAAIEARARGLRAPSKK